jgi:hypothetical protein
MSADPWKQRVDAGDWTAITAEVNEYAARSPELLTAGEMSSPSSHPAVWRVHAASPNTDGYGPAAAVTSKLVAVQAMVLDESGCSRISCSCHSACGF